MKLVTWRKSNGLSQPQLAERLGLKSRVSVARYERGRIPEKNVLERIIELTGGRVTANDWFDVPEVTGAEKTNQPAA